jgi:4-diphosphocytidyl-2-C-methyl-D-erythritol kinase
MEPRVFSDLAPAKVNLFLLVTGKRADGYHLLDSLVVFAGAHDRLSATPADEITLTLGGTFGASLAAETDNLVLRAAHGLASATGIRAGARLHLDKNLPMASGIGGGSSDAAASLRLLSRLWGVAVPEGLDATLGADVPVCLDPMPRRMRGIGERLSPAPSLPRCGMVLVNPGLALPTASVFRARQAGLSAEAVLPAAWPDTAALARWLEGCGNDLEAPAITLCPPIAQVLAALRAQPGCRLARMSGSGATCFGLFDTALLATAAASALSRPGWWCWGGGLYDRGGET